MHKLNDLHHTAFFSTDYVNPTQKHRQVTTNLTSVSISEYDLPFSYWVTNLGFYLDETLYILNSCVIFFFVSNAD